MSSALSLETRRALAASVPNWFHSFDFGDGIAVSGHKSLRQLKEEWSRLELEDLTGKSVLDVNTWDGWFAIEAERRGAARVVGLDWYMWCMDQKEHSAYWTLHKQAGTLPKPYHEMPYFKPAELPGKIGFDVARRLKGSKVEEFIADFATVDIAPLRGRFDVVLYLGTLYHMADPIGNLRRLYEVTAPGGIAIIESQAIEVAGIRDVPLWESYGPLNCLNADVSNWWAPNDMALRQAVLAVGFDAAETIVPPPHFGREITRRDSYYGPLKWLNADVSTGPPPHFGREITERDSYIRSYRAYVRGRRAVDHATKPNPVPTGSRY